MLKMSEDESDNYRKYGVYKWEAEGIAKQPLLLITNLNSPGAIEIKNQTTTEIKEPNLAEK